MANPRITDGAYDWSDGIDSNKIATVASDLNPNGLRRSQLAWLVNGTVRGGSITQRTGWQPLQTVLGAGWWQGGWVYEPDAGNPYLVCSIGGHIIQVLLEAPYTITDLSLAFGLTNPATTERAFFCQGENYLIIQAGDYGQVAVPTLPLFWDGTTLTRSVGILTATNNPANELPAATCMDYYMGRIWYAQGRSYGAGDIVKSHVSGTAPNDWRDSILHVSESPLVFGGDNFVVPDNAGNIRAIAHTEAIDTATGQGMLFIFTRKSIYSLQVPVSRNEWIATNNNAGAGNTMPLQRVVQVRYGATSDRCVVRVNGDLFYQTMEPGIRSLTLAVRFFKQWSNTDISANETRILQYVDRSLLDHASGIEFGNRLLQTSRPFETPVGVAHAAIIPMDFDPIGSFGENKNPVWEGHHEGLDILQLFEDDFGGRARAFCTIVSRDTGAIDLWEITDYERRENGDNRVTWSMEFPAFTWGKEYALKDLESAELWIDKLFGTVDFRVEFRPDSDPCWHLWSVFQRCSSRNCEEETDDPLCYPTASYRESYDAMISLPKPPTFCASNGGRPVNRGYQFQVRLIIKGWCRVRGFLLHGLPVEKAPFENMACQTMLRGRSVSGGSGGGAVGALVGIIGETLQDTEFIQGEGGDEILIGES